MEFLEYSLLAFAGGIILNIMPCVLPVLTMKVFHVVETAQESPAENRRLGSAYGLGVLVFFGIYTGLVVSLKLVGQSMGWGQQFQNPYFVAPVVLVLFVFGLNALGVFEFTVSGRQTSAGGVKGAFFTGILASIMATPCSAPLLGPAATFALESSSISVFETSFVLMMIGVGFAFPFVLISFVPAVARLLPRPGAWMETFKQLMGFTLLGAAIWLFDTLQKQLSPDSLFWFVSFLLLVAVGLWAIQSFGGLQHSTGRRLGVRFAVMVVLVGGAMFCLPFERATKKEAIASSVTEPPVKDGEINWTPFTPNRVALANKRNRPVFVDYTADWCANCKTNEKVVLETDTVRKALMETNILPVKADWTNEDEVIEEWLEKLGRSGIPAYAIYYPDGTYDLLPETITPSMVDERLRKAAAKHPEDKFLSIEQACLVTGPVASPSGS
jgi:thiol:disulfide interchange protein DsbD